MDKKELAAKAVELLKKEYPDAICSLEYVKPHELLFATRLAAQCTDARVDMVTPVLYSKYPTLEALANADEQDISDIIRSCGFYKTKGKNIIASSSRICTEFGGTVPDNMDDLLSLAGVGRKTANLLLGDLYQKGGIVADTHCIRISNRLALCDKKDPVHVEKTLVPLIAPEKSSDFCHRLVWFGRDVCMARSPKCEECLLRTRGLCTHEEK